MIKTLVTIGVLSVGLPLGMSLTALANTRPPANHFGGGSRDIHVLDITPTLPGGHTNIHLAGHLGSHTHTVPYGYTYGERLGTLHVNRLGNRVPIFGGATLAAMDAGAGHFAHTGLDQGNVGLIGHNRGRTNGFFSFVRHLREGDTLQFERDGNKRTFVVSSHFLIDETDWSPLRQFGDNRLTLITCVEYQPSQRRVVVALEV